MKKLTVALILVGLLTLPMVGLAEGQGNPPKPGNQKNPALFEVWYVIFYVIGAPGYSWIGGETAFQLYYYGTPAWPSTW
jgi:hypothetical protein